MEKFEKKRKKVRIIRNRQSYDLESMHAHIIMIINETISIHKYKYRANNYTFKKMFQMY